MSNPSVSASIDAQMSMFEVIRPADGFEALYQGQAGNIPIAFPGVLDQDAGKPGYAARLLAGIPVPLGARLLLQIPMTVGSENEDPPVSLDKYQYQIVWRTRNQGAAREDIISGRRQPAPYHLPDEAQGRQENGSLIFIPGASDIEIFESADTNPGILNVRQQRYVPQVTSPWVPPLLPGGNSGIWQQGAYAFTTSPVPSGPTWCPIWMDAGGDEMLILAYKVDSEAPWDFTSFDDDLAFSNTYGTSNGTLPVNPNIGLLLSSGSQGT